MSPPGLTPGRFPIITLAEIPFTFEEVGKGSGWEKAAEPHATRISEVIKRFNLDGQTVLDELKAEMAK